MQRLDLTGQRFGSLVVKSFAGVKGQRTLWLCMCDCGNQKTTAGVYLKTGRTKSCGCLKSPEELARRMKGNKLNLGKKRSPESRAKTSASLTGRMFTPEHCANIKKSRDAAFRQKMKERMSGEGNPMYGKTTSDEVKEKLRAAMKGNTHLLGHRHTLDTCQKISDAQRQEKHWNWQGGIGLDPYCKEFRDNDYRASLYERDEHRCQNPNCWGTTHRLCHHHINYNKEDCAPQNLITLCISCNTRANAKKEWHAAYYKQILTRKIEVQP